MSKKVETLQDKLKKLQIIVLAAKSLGVYDDSDWIQFAEKVNEGFRKAGLKDFPAKSTSPDGSTNDRYRNLHMAICLLKKEILSIPNVGISSDDLVFPSRPPTPPKKSPTWKEVLATEEAQKILSLLKDVVNVNGFSDKDGAEIDESVESIASK